MRFIPHIVWVIGAVIMLFAFGDHSGALLPYQDATPELLAVQRGQIEFAKKEAWVGGLIVMSGFAWVFIRRRLRH